MKMLLCLRAIMDGRSQTGIVYNASIEDYLDNVIKKQKAREKIRS